MLKTYGLGTRLRKPVGVVVVIDMNHYRDCYR